MIRIHIRFLLLKFLYYFYTFFLTKDYKNALAANITIFLFMVSFFVLKNQLLSIVFVTLSAFFAIKILFLWILEVILDENFTVGLYKYISLGADLWILFVSISMIKVVLKVFELSEEDKKLLEKSKTQLSEAVLDMYIEFAHLISKVVDKDVLQRREYK